jgi:Arc/MetJ-type ribon-helix-helix transcriptional regulator
MRLWPAARTYRGPRRCRRCGEADRRLGPAPSSCVPRCVTRCDTILHMKVPISARLDAELVAFLDGIRESRGLASRSEALELAIRALRDTTLEAEYAAAMEEWSTADAALWDGVVLDGLETDASR